MALVDATEAYADPDFLYTAAVGVREAAGATSVLLAVDSIHSWASGGP